MVSPNPKSLLTLVAALTLALGCALYTAPDREPSPPRATGPTGSGPVFSDGPRQLAPVAPPTRNVAVSVPEGTSSDCFQGVSGPATVDVGSLPADAGPSTSLPFPDHAVDAPELPISEEEAARLRAEAMLLQPDPDIQVLDPTRGGGLVPGASFDAIDASECCAGGGTSVPPDPELSAGPHHLIAVVNTSFKILDKSGTVLVGPTDLDTLFGNLAGCTGLFDPNTLYDEEDGRSFIGADDGDAYCLAVSQTADPLGTWNLYRIPTLEGVGVGLFDYPHGGIGDDAIFWGSNQFVGPGQPFVEGRIWAIDKAAIYAGDSNPTCRTQSTGDDSTPWPADIHVTPGDPFPSGGHYLMTEVFDGANHSVWQWTNALGGGSATNLGDVDLNAATGVTAGLPIDAPQAGSSDTIAANDFRGQSTFYRNGHLWMTNQAISCNPGGGVVDCSRWAEIDPTGPSVVQAGVLASDGDFRLFSSLAVNRCDGMAMGYSITRADSFPGTFVVGRESGDPTGTVSGQLTLKAGEVTYFSFDGSPLRWGDYTGMTIDPDGETFWYLGEYSKNGVSALANWGNFIGSFTFADCANSIFADGFESGDTSAWDQTVG